MMETFFHQKRRRKSQNGKMASLNGSSVLNVCLRFLVEPSVEDLIVSSKLRFKVSQHLPSGVVRKCESHRNLTFSGVRRASSSEELGVGGRSVSDIIVNVFRRPIFYPPVGVMEEEQCFCSRA